MTRAYSAEVETGSARGAFSIGSVDHSIAIMPPPIRPPAMVIMTMDEGRENIRAMPARRVDIAALVHHARAAAVPIHRHRRAGIRETSEAEQNRSGGGDKQCLSDGNLLDLSGLSWQANVVPFTGKVHCGENSRRKKETHSLTGVEWLRVCHRTAGAGFG